MYTLFIIWISFWQGSSLCLLQREIDGCCQLRNVFLITTESLKLYENCVPISQSTCIKYLRCQNSGIISAFVSNNIKWYSKQWSYCIQSSLTWTHTCRNDAVFPHYWDSWTPLTERRNTPALSGSLSLCVSVLVFPVSPSAKWLIKYSSLRKTLSFTSH